MHVFFSPHRRVFKTIMSGLPPLSPAAGNARPSSSSVPPSRASGRASVGRASNRSNNSNNDPLPPASERGSVAPSQRSERSARSQASAGHGSQRTASAGRASNKAPSQRSSAGRSISSSVALSKLQQLEDMLLEERRAREQAELTLLQMKKSDLERHESVRRGEHAQKQLTEVMGALQRVLAEPHDAGGIKKLQGIVRGAPVRSVNTPSERSGSQPQEGGSFLDNIGQYERDRKARGRK